MKKTTVVVESLSNNTTKCTVPENTSLLQDRIRCYMCKECDHFKKDSPTSKEEREIEPIQEMFNLDKEQTSLSISYRHE